MSLYEIILHARALEGLCLTAAIGLHMWRHPVKRPADEADGTELARTTIYSPPSYGLRVVR